MTKTIKPTGILLLSLVLTHQPAKALSRAELLLLSALGSATTVLAVIVGKQQGASAAERENIQLIRDLDLLDLLRRRRIIALALLDKKGEKAIASQLETKENYGVVYAYNELTNNSTVLEAAQRVLQKKEEEHGWADRTESIDPSEPWLVASQTTFKYSDDRFKELLIPGSTGK